MENSIKITRAVTGRPQFQVRTGLRSGNVLDKCQRDVAELKQRYQELLNEARRRGFHV